MNIAVCIKPAIPSAAVVYAGDTGQPLRPDTVRMGETDAVALEAALDLRAAHGGEVTVLTVADERADRWLAHCLNRGADRALRIDHVAEGTGPDTARAARLAAGMLRSLAADVVLCASRSADSGSGFFPYALAAAAQFRLVTQVIDIEAAAGTVTAVRKLERGWRERYRLELPLVIAVEEELRRPQHVAVLSRSYRRGMGLAVERSAPDATEASADSTTRLREEALSLPQPRRRAVARSKPRTSARDRLRRKQPAAGGTTAEPVRLDGDPEAIARRLIAAIRGWLDKAGDEPSP